MLGNAGNDTMLGLDGDDTLEAGDGWCDIIVGGVGADTLTGGAGHDFFAFTSISEAGDTITDFTTTAGADLDILDLRPVWATFSIAPGLTSVADAVASGHLSFIQAGADTQVLVDANGGANAGDQVVLATLTNTSASAVQALTLI